MKSIPGCALTNLTTYNHVPTALHVGFRNRPDILSLSPEFDMHLAIENENARGHGVICNFGGRRLPSSSFVDTRSDVLIPFMGYCAAEERLCADYYGEAPRVKVQDILQEELAACSPNSGIPAVVSTYRLFNPIDKVAAGSSYLCNLTDAESLACAVRGGMNKDLATQLHGLSQSQGEIMYITHAIALRSVRYSPPGQAPTVVPENYDQQTPGWTVYVMGERMLPDGTMEGHAYPVSFNTRFRETMAQLSQIQDAFIMRKLDNRSYALNERDKRFHYESFIDRAPHIDMALGGINSFGGQLSSAFKLG